MKALGRKVTIDESLPLKRQFGHLYLELDLGAFKIFVPAIVLIFVVTALVITVFLMFQWITEKKAEIGVMMSLGYRTRDIVLSFGMPVLVIAFIALISGTLLAFVMLYGFGPDYAKALGLPTPQRLHSTSPAQWACADARSASCRHRGASCSPAWHASNLCLNKPAYAGEPGNDMSPPNHARPCSRDSQLLRPSLTFRACSSFATAPRLANAGQSIRPLFRPEISRFPSAVSVS